MNGQSDSATTPKTDPSAGTGWTLVKAMAVITEPTKYTKEQFEYAKQYAEKQSARSI